jgi:hypothetical protein
VNVCPKINSFGGISSFGVVVFWTDNFVGSISFNRFVAWSAWMLYQRRHRSAVRDVMVEDDRCGRAEKADSSVLELR